jgi:hypothetical protein
MDPFPSRSTFMDALVDAAKRTSTDEFRRLVAWVKRAARDGFVPPGVTLADALDLQIRALRQGRCAVPYCRCRASKAKSPRHGRGQPPDLDPENRLRLCRTHRRLRREGFLRVEGRLESPRLFGRVGGEIRFPG